MQEIINSFSLMSGWEFLAVAFGIAYVLLAAKESLWTWFFAFFGTLIYTLLFWEGALVSSSVLNFYYMIMAVYGFILWRGGKEEKPLTITTYTLSQHSQVIIGGLIGSVVLGYLSDTYLDANHAYLDAFVMTFSVIATWMLANKILENWLYWMVVDSAGTYLYFKSEYYATVVLFTLYVVLAFWGYYSWRKEYRAN
ncbi:nicotinamide riboside transporter PnuC [bacterium]|nr:nicotinamide riboside transporter PnuC [bacterium]MBU1959207.1 nicotinamide riboside transporter PnuC [bacterium]